MILPVSKGELSPHYLKGYCKKERDSIFSRVKENGFKVKEERFRLNIRRMSLCQLDQ